MWSFLTDQGRQFMGLTFLSQQSHVARTPTHQHTQNARCRLRVGRHQPTNRCRQWTKIYQVFLFNAGETVVDNAVYHMSISLFIPEIFAFKVKSCPKSCRILDVLRYPKFYGGVVPPPKKNCTHVISPTWHYVTWQSFTKLLPLALKLQWLIRYN